MKSILFFVALLIIGLIAYYQSTRIIESVKEGFQDPGINVPVVLEAKALFQGDSQPFAPPTTEMLAPLPGQTASVLSSPYEDPALAKAPVDRIKNALVTLDGFLENEGPGLAKLGDPSVQLPLGTAKGDKQRLSDEVLVMERNPGLPSSLTQGDVDGIEANTAYLQRKWRLSANSLSGEVEPFYGGNSQGDIEGFTAADSSNKSPPATVQELTTLSQKIGIEIIRLGSSVTMDPITQSRISTLTTVQKAVEQILSDVKAGIKKPADVPITSAEVAAFLPVMGNPNSALPKLIEQTNSSSALNNLFSAFSSSDISGSQVAAALFSKYADTLMQNISWELKLNYMSKGEKELATMYAQNPAAVAPLRQDDTSDLQDSIDISTVNAPRGFFDTVVGALGNGRAPIGSSSVATGLSGRGNAPMASAFDWKQRSSDICQQIAGRGLTPGDYGCMMNPDANVDPSFSWRGYARMICHRLTTNYDAGVPSACGCPPASWPGWKA